MRSCAKYVAFFMMFVLLCAGCSNDKSSLPGYIEGEYTYISSGVSGTLFDLYVVRGQQVQKGDLLYVLDPQPEAANVDAIKANIADLQAQVDFAKIHFERQKALYPRNATTKESVDQALSDFKSKSQLLAANRAQLIQGIWSLQQKTISAPIGGEVFDTFYRVGEKVQEYHPILALLAPKNIKVLFYVPETRLSQIKLGQKVAFSCDSCQAKVTAKISYISPEAEYTPPVIYSKDTRAKLVYLIRADMPEDIAQQFHPGQPITVDLSYE